jgi:hypothetical protein
MNAREGAFYFPYDGSSIGSFAKDQIRDVIKGELLWTDSNINPGFPSLGANGILYPSATNGARQVATGSVSSPHLGIDAGRTHPVGNTVKPGSISLQACITF